MCGTEFGGVMSVGLDNEDEKRTAKSDRNANDP